MTICIKAMFCTPASGFDLPRFAKMVTGVRLPHAGPMYLWPAVSDMVWMSGVALWGVRPGALPPRGLVPASPGIFGPE